MKTYSVLQDGEGLELSATGEVFRLACCDCGLVHDVAVALEENGKIGIALRRNQRATGQRRRRMPNGRRNQPGKTGGTMRNFWLERIEDESGVSGVGVVAEGTRFSSGKCVLAWLTQFQSVAVYDSIEELENVHGHNGKTVVVWQSFLAPGVNRSTGAQLVYQPVQPPVAPPGNRLGITGDTSPEAIRRVYAETGSLSETARRCFGYKDGYSFSAVKAAVGQ